MHGSYIGSDNGLLTAQSERFSDYGSDTISVSSSEDQWGAQIGGYNENSTEYPPPPVVLMPQALQSAESIAGADLAAMLEVGFEDKTSPAQSRAPSTAPRYQLSDRVPLQNGYSPLARSTSPGLQPANAVSSGVGEWKTHAKKRSGGRSISRDPGYGPLGPLDPGTNF